MSEVLYSVYIIFMYHLITVSSHVSSDLGLTEGVPCTANGTRGTCLNIYDCPTAAATHLYQQAGFIEQSRALQSTIVFCSYDKDEPIVCCTDCQPPDFKCVDYYQRLPYWWGGAYNLLRRWNKIDQCYKLYYAFAFAIGSSDAERYEYPNMALLGYGADKESAQWICGGSIISERYILTAAHCASTPLLGPIKYAAVGILKRTDPDELWNDYDIKKIIMHPDYKSPSKYNDIALLETEKEIIFSRAVLPACLDVGKMCFAMYGKTKATGWGKLGPKGGFADNLQVVILQEYTESECAELYGVHRHMKSGYNHTTQMCYGDRDNIINTCEGDSGGPLLVSDSNNQYTVLGVTSYGYNCGAEGSAGIYTRVRPYVPWIESVVWPNDTWTDAVGTLQESVVLGFCNTESTQNLTLTNEMIKELIDEFPDEEEDDFFF